MMPPSRRPHQEDNVDSWLMSYADMITLLLCFFIIFVSVSVPRKEDLSAIAESMGAKFGTVDLSLPFKGIFTAEQAVVEKQGLLKDVAITGNATTIDMELSGIAFYQPDSAEFNDTKMAALNAMVDALKGVHVLNYRIIVEGHSSDAPPRNAIFPSNWEFTSARASRMVRFFIEQGIPADHLKAIGYADTVPKVPNLDASGQPIPENRAKNERIIIRLERVS